MTARLQITASFHPRLRRAEAVETTGIICPLGVAKVGRTVRECVGSQRRPDWIGKIRAGFHHDDQIAAPGDVEAKQVRPHAEAGIILRPRVPQLCWTTGKRLAPARRPQQVINRRIVVTGKRRWINARRVTFKIDAGQVVAVTECIGPDADDAVWNRDAGQVGTFIKSIASDVGDAVADGHARQAGAARKRKGSDAGDTIGNLITARQTGGELDQGRLLFVKQHARDAGIGWIVRSHRNIRQAGAVSERRFSDVGDAVADVHARQAGACIERKVSDAGDAVGNRHARQAGAQIERKVSDAGDAVGNRHARQAVAVLERKLSDAGDAVGNRDAGQTVAAIELPASDAGDVGAYRDIGQAGAVFERKVFDAGDAVGNRDARQAGAVLERKLSDAGDAVGDRDAGQASAVVERIVSDASNAVADGHARQAGAAIESIVSDAGDVGAYRDIGQAGAVFERRVSDAGDTVGNSDAGQTGAGIERRVSDAGDWQTIGRAGDDHHTARTVVFVEVERTVIIGRELKLGLHHGGQHRRTDQANVNEDSFGFHGSGAASGIQTPFAPNVHPKMI